MTEAEWLGCTDPFEMCQFVLAQPAVVRRKEGRRRLRLSAAACCRSLRRWMTDPRCLAAVEVAERLADGLATRGEADRVQAGAWEVYREQTKRHFVSNMGSYDEHGCSAQSAAQDAASLLDNRSGNYGVAGVCWAGVRRENRGYRAYRKRCRWQADMLRCVFGNPFRPVSLDPGCRTPTVLALAEAAYQERLLPSGELDRQRLGVLTDALEEAGADADIIAHLRSSGPHVRGCWAVDAALAKE